jgi:hypothetical protein
MGSNEGFNSYYQQMAAAGEPVYGKAPQFFYANYGPLSFHLIGTLGRVVGNINLTGRWVSVLSYLSIALWISLIVERLGGQRVYGLFAAACWLIWVAGLDPARIGFNDPHLFGMALNLAAFYCFLRDRESNRWLTISALLFALSLFTKQTLLAFPGAVAVELLLTSRRRFLLWSGILGGACVVLLAVTLAIDGHYFLAHLSLPRNYSMAGVLGNAETYLSFVHLPFLIALFWMLRGTVPVNAKILIWSFVFAHVFGLIYCSGDGASVNHMFDAMVVTAIIAGLVLPVLGAMAAGTMPGMAAAFVFVLAFSIGALLVLPQRVPLDLARYEKGMPALESEFGHAVEFVRSQPGQALCENLLLCFEAGKPIFYDAFAGDQAIKTGHLDESIILRQLAARQLGSVQIEITQGEVVQPVARHRFSKNFMTQLLTSYRLAARSSRYAFFVPKLAN